MKKIVLLLLSCLLLINCGGGASERQLYSFSQGSAGFYYNPPTLVGDFIYIGTSRGVLYDVASDNYFIKLNLNLTKAWEYPLGNKEVRGGATLDSAGNIYFVIEEGRLKGDTSKLPDIQPPDSKLYLYSLDNNGVFRWSKIITSSVYGMGMSNPAIAADNTIYIGGDKFYALDTSGNEKWTYRNNMTIMNAPIIDPNGNIYFNAAGFIISLDSNGTERWNFPTFSGESLSSPAFSIDYSKIFVGVENKVYCLQTSTGTKVWEFTPAGNDGSGILWENKIGADLYSSPALGNDNTVYVGSEYSGGRRLHALDMTTGNTKWSASLGADATWSSPAISDKGTLYIASMDHLGSGGGVYAFRTDSTGLLPGAGSPRFHGGNASTGRRE